MTEIINEEHENRKYLPGVALGENVVAIPDIGEAVKGATVLIFVMPHQCKLRYPYRCRAPADSSVLVKTLDQM